MSKRSKAGTSKASAAKRRTIFAATYVANGENGTQAAIAAGFAEKSAHVTAARLLKDAKVLKRIEKSRGRAVERAQLTADEVLLSLARDLRFDPAKLYHQDGRMKALHELDADTRLALRGVEVDQILQEKVLVGRTVKVKFPEKTAAREQGMKHFGLYEKDNRQKPNLPPEIRLKFV